MQSSRPVRLGATKTLRTSVAVLFAAVMLQACDGGGSDGPGPVTPPPPPPADNISQAITAAQGGTVTVPNGAVVLTVPPAALDKDSTVTITKVTTPPPALPTNMTANGDTYSVTFSNGAVLSTPMQVKMKATAAPTHPQLGEVAALVSNAWQRVGSNFYRASDTSVLALTSQATTFRVVNRSLQKVTGATVAMGQDLFLNETFGNESFFGAIGLHTVLNGVSPADAVALGAQVDLAKVPAGIAAVLTGTDNAAKTAALGNPAVTRALIQAGAVVGVKGVFGDTNNPDMMTAAGITCALCHVNVTPTTFQLASGPTPLPIGPLSIDGIPNLKMDAGKILSFTPGVMGISGASAVLAAWGPNNFDIRALPDNAPLDDGINNPTQVPPLWNFVDLEKQDYLYDWDGLFRGPAGMRGTPQDDSLASQAEAVYDLVMHANGAFGIPNVGALSPVLSIAPPQALVDLLVAAENGAPGNPLITLDKLRAVQDFERSITSPAPGTFNETMAQQGFLLFNGKANCTLCHSTAEFTGVQVTKIADRALQGGLAGGIKTPGLRGISKTAPFFHDGSAATLEAVVDQYIKIGRTPALSTAEKAALVEYMKSL